VDVGGKRFSHIVDPRSGYGLTNRIQVTVRAKQGFITDPLATALNVMPPSKWQPLLDRFGAKATYLLGD
jgi:thiamine biosynthesis lipoprotein